MSFLVDRHKKQWLASTFATADSLKIGAAKPEKPCGLGLACGYFTGLRAGFCPPVYLYCVLVVLTASPEES